MIVKELVNISNLVGGKALFEEISRADLIEAAVFQRETCTDSAINRRSAAITRANNGK